MPWAELRIRPLCWVNSGRMAQPFQAAPPRPLYIVPWICRALVLVLLLLLLLLTPQELRHFYCYEGGGTEEKWYPLLLLRRPFMLEISSKVPPSSTTAGVVVVSPKGQSQIVHCLLPHPPLSLSLSLSLRGCQPVCPRLFTYSAPNSAFAHSLFLQTGSA